MSKKIRLNATEDVKEFVKAASKCDFDVDISYNRILIDAKSILGILSMDLTRVLTVTCHGEDHEFDRFLQKYAVQRQTRYERHKKKRQTRLQRQEISLKSSAGVCFFFTSIS